MNQLLENRRRQEALRAEHELLRLIEELTAPDSFHGLASGFLQAPVLPPPTIPGIPDWKFAA